MLDSLSDLLARIKNAQKAGHDEVRLPFFRLGLAVIKALKQEGYLGGFQEKTEEGGKKWIEVRLRYVGRREREPLIQSLNRASRPGRRIYRGHADIPQVRSGIGFSILSTSQGVMTDRQAREKKIGGEVLCTVY